MPFLFREIVFCKCGRPALAAGGECRTCYEDAFRREWREARRTVNALGVPEPVKMIKPRLRELYAPESEEDAEREPASNERWYGQELACRLSQGENENP